VVEFSGNSFGELFFRSLVQSMPGALAATDARGRQLFVNPAFCALVGWSEEDLLGKQAPFPYWAPEDASSILEQFRGMLTSNDPKPTTFIQRFRRRNEERFLVRLRAVPLYNTAGGLNGWLASVEDLQQLEEVKALLRDRDRFIESVAHAIPEIIYVFDIPQNCNVYANRQIAEALGFTAADIQAMGAEFLATLLHPDDQARLTELFGRWATARDGQIIETEYRMRSARGEYRWFQARDTVFQRDAAGRVVQFIGAAQDITVRKVAEEARADSQKSLQESELRYRLLADHSCDMISRHSPSGVYRDVSPACVRLLGYIPAELVGRSGYEIIHPDDRDTLYQHHLQIVEEKKTMTLTFRARRKDGVYIWLEINAQPILDPTSREVVELLAVSRDITDRRHAEEALRQSEELFRALVEKSNDGIALVEKGGRIRYLSPAASRVLGYEQVDLAGMNAKDVVLPDDLDLFVARANETLSKPDGSASGTLRARGKDGNSRHLEVIVTNHMADDSIQGFVVNFRDISDRIVLEEQLRQMQKMEAVGQLAGGIAHDFNNILTAIIGNVSLMLDSSLSEVDHARLVGIDKAAHRAAELTHRLLGYSRRTTLLLKPANLNRIVEESLSLLRPTIDPRIVYYRRFDPDLWPAIADADQISQIITNLCLNSRDAMPKGGRLAVQTANVVVDDEYVRGQVIAQPGEFVCLTIADTGAGMTPEVQARVFEPFFTTKPQGAGTGLGLAMVYGIAKAHGGWVTCESEFGVGTRMDLFLPRSRTPMPLPATGEQARGQASPSTRGETILFVDDEPTIRMLGRHVLEQNGYRVLLAEDGIDALETFQEIADQVSLVVLDLTMPRLSGQDTYRRLKEIRPSIRVLFSSGYSAEHLAELESGFGFISKPYLPAELLEAVRVNLNPVDSPS